MVLETKTTGAVIRTATEDEATRLVKLEVVASTTDELVEEIGTISIAIGGSQVLKKLDVEIATC